MVFSYLSGTIKLPLSSTLNLREATPIGPQNIPPIFSDLSRIHHLVKVDEKESCDRSNKSKDTEWWGMLVYRKKKFKALKRPQERDVGGWFTHVKK